MKIANKINTIICDDVRQETGGRISLMGIYSKYIVVENIPTVLPILHLVIMMESVQKIFDRLYITITKPKSKPASFEPAAPPDLEIGSDVNIAIALHPFKINELGTWKFSIRFEKEERPRIIHRIEVVKRNN